MNIIPVKVVELSGGQLVVRNENINNSDPSARTSIIERNRSTLTAKLVLEGWTLEAAQVETAELDFPAIAEQLSAFLREQAGATTS
jgi:hypothetical protein